MNCRKKQLVKLQNGEYISLAKIETTLALHPLVEMACVVGNSLKNLPVAILVPDMEKLTALASANQLIQPMATKEKMCDDPEVRQAVLETLTDDLRDRGFQRYEIPMAYHLAPDGPWTPESGLVTGAMKLRRRQVEDRYKQAIERMFDKK